MPRPQFTLRALLVAMLVVAAFFGGIRFERERRRLADEAEDVERAAAIEEWQHPTLRGPFTRVYPILGSNGENSWVMEPPSGALNPQHESE